MPADSETQELTLEEVSSQLRDVMWFEQDHFLRWLRTGVEGEPSVRIKLDAESVAARAADTPHPISFDFDGMAIICRAPGSCLRIMHPSVGVFGLAVDQCVVLSPHMRKGMLKSKYY